MKNPSRIFKYISSTTGEVLGYYSFKKSYYRNGNTRYQIVDPDTGEVIEEVTVDINEQLTDFQIAVKRFSSGELLLKSLGIIDSSSVVEISDEYVIYTFDQIEIEHYTSESIELRVIKGGGSETCNTQTKKLYPKRLMILKPSMQ